uniref:Uncharacterized protein n=1 Tax=Globisporangium ultimum (strain ATCC 200006 / CBS 805.95 / DAOM BR144) TaxID=431595 RepID=K3X851_GLOUD
MFAGGFKYRNISDRLRNVETTSSTASNSSNQSPESSRGSAASTKEQGGLGVRSRKQSDVDLDSLRAAALSTKRMLKQLESQQEADATKKSADEVASSSPDAAACEGAKASQEAASMEETPPDIEALRAEILRSMMKKKKATTSAPAATAMATKSSAPSNNAANVTPEITGAASAATIDSVIQSEVNGQKAKKMTPETASAGSTESAAAEQEKVADYEKFAEKDSAAASASSPSSSRPVTPAAPINTAHADAISTPKFRPLTASSQSIVIRLSPEDYMKSSKASDVSGSGSSEGVNAANGAALTIQSAIEEMRKQIAEKEKLRRASRPEVAVVPSIGSQEASAVPLVLTNGAVTNGADEVPTSDSTQPPVSSEQQQQKAPTSTMKNAATRSSLQAKIDEMKKRIAAKEREKKNHSANSNINYSNSASATTPSSSASSSSSSSSSSPRGRLKNGEAIHLDGNVTKESKAPSAPPSASTKPNSASSAEEPVPAIAKDKLTLEEYRKTYEKYAADYEAATRQVATLDDTIAKLRDQIAAMEPPASTVLS